MLQQLRASTCRVAQCWCVHEAPSRDTPLSHHLLSTYSLVGSCRVGCGFYSRDAKPMGLSAAVAAGFHLQDGTVLVGLCGQYSGSSVLQSLFSSL